MISWNGTYAQELYNEWECIFSLRGLVMLHEVEPDLNLSTTLKEILVILSSQVWEGQLLPELLKDDC